ncbi:MAG: hypothetical protein HYV60_14835 [Planctomycetia bacterium]|nr:hypothetical protein [Planctomycetia bacterium]
MTKNSSAQFQGLYVGLGFLTLACRLLTSVFLLHALLGCGKPETTKPKPPEASRVARTKVERGPVIVTVEVAPEPARLSDEPTLTLTVDHEQGVEVTMPPFGESIGNFIIRDFREPLPETRDQRQVVRQIYTLEPTTTGALQIEPMTITFDDTRPNGDGQTHTIETESLRLNVLSVVASDAPSLADLEGFAAPVDLPPSRVWIGWSIGGAIVLLVGVAVAGAFIARRRRNVVEKPLTPRELADRELAELWRDKASREDVKVFYVRLTAIVRNYIEGTTGVHAPEQTTEEFLREIGAGERFSRDERQRLKDFLESADLVKFARFRPQASDVDESYQRARRFVGLAEGEAAA